MNVLKQIFSGATSGLIGSIGDALDKNITSKEERLKLKNELTEIVTSKTAEMQKLQTEVLTAELSGNWLQKSWRPITMLCFLLVVLYKYIFSQIFSLPEIELPGDFWQLLKLGFGGYIAGRSGEKIAGVVGKHFGKKKDD